MFIRMPLLTSVVKSDFSHSTYYIQNLIPYRMHRHQCLSSEEKARSTLFADR